MIAENLNVMDKTLRQAMKERKKEPLQKIAREAAKRGLDVLDLNIGPARKDGPSLMEWVIAAVREVADLPLSLDTTNIEAMRVGLEMEGDRAIINSIQATPERMEQLLPLMQKHGARCIALLIGKEGMPRDATERGALAAEFAAAVDEYGIPHERVFFDPVVLPVAYQQDQVVAVIEFMRMLKEMLPDFNSTCGLSNVSNGVPAELRPLVNRTYLAMLADCGMTSAIVDLFDSHLVSLARGGSQNIAGIIRRTVEGNEDFAGLSEEETAYAKTVRVLLGKTIYSHSWLKL